VQSTWQTEPTRENPALQLTQTVVEVQMLQPVPQRMQVLPERILPGWQLKQRVLVVLQVRQAVASQGRAREWFKPSS
jgi:hypothetical protein